MRQGRVLVVAVVLLGLAGCGTEGDPTLMPEVTGQQLDAALTAIEDAGFTKDVDVEGGGVFGVVDESNWQVCAQAPGAGLAVDKSVQLTVDRSCGDEADVTPAPDDQSTEPEPAPMSSEPGPITSASDPEFAAALVDGDYCSDAIAQFAGQNEGQVIEFDGSVVAMANRDGSTTRYDFLLAAGDFSERSQAGPVFRLEDVNATNDMHWTNDSATSTVGVGDNLHVVARIDGFVEQSCWLVIDPVAMSFR